MWLDNLKRMKAESGLTTKEISLQSGIPEPTLEKLFAGSTKDPKLETMRQIVHFFGHTLDDLDDTHPKIKKAPSLSDEAMKLAKDYDINLDDWGQKAVRGLVDTEIARCEAERRLRQLTRQDTELAADLTPRTKIIPLLGNSFAAGRGDPDYGNPWEDYEVLIDTKADFAVRINGDSMEPYLPDKSIQLCRKGDPADGDVAVLLVDGEFLCKQVCKDSFNNLYLFSLNRARQDADQTIWHNSERTVSCFGTVILPKRIPLPDRMG